MVKTRVTLSLDEYSFKLLSAISEDLGQTKSEVFNELMNLMGPALAHISATKRMVDAGLKATGEEAFRGFLRGMQEDFQQSIAEAEEAFFAPGSRPEEEAEDMQADEREAAREPAH